MGAKDAKISELNKQVMMQEGAIQGWLDTIEQKRSVIKGKDSQIDELEQELNGQQLKNQQLGKRVNKLELDLAEAIQNENMKVNEMLELKKTNETLKNENDRL